jgi:hypothetical protein
MTRPALEWLTAADVLEKNLLPPSHARAFAFGSSYLCSAIRGLLTRAIPDDSIYIRRFDLFDALVGLVFRDLTGGDGSPIGVYVWRWIARRVEHPLQEYVRSAAADRLLAEGFFQGTRTRLDELMAAQEGRIEEARRAFH